jgi:Ankyrin repeat
MRSSLIYSLVDFLILLMIACFFHRGESEKDAARRADTNSTTMDLQTLIRRQQWEEIKARLEVYPHEAGETLTGIVTRGGFVATDGCTPLHYAVERRPPADVVEALMTAWPEAVATRMQPGGALPLHVACTWHASANVVSILCQREPMACRTPDELGNVPLHHAAFSGAMVTVVDVLLRAYPKAVLARNLQGSLPADICKRLRHENRKNILVLLTTRKELVVRHSRSLSNGTMGMIAQQAMDLNLAIGPPMSPRLAPITSVGEDKSHESGIEVQVDTGGDEMIWI